jgi:MFS family permease
VFRSLDQRNFRLYFFGQMASTCGTWAQTVALAWLVLKTTGSGTQVGLVTAVQFLPVLLLGAWSGVVADRFDNRRAVIAVQSLLCAQAGVLAVVVFTGLDHLWVIYVLAAIQGVGTACDTPTRQSLVGQLVGDGHLANALSLNAGVVQLARVVGPAVAGILIATVGSAECFVLNATSYLVIIVCVTLLDGSAIIPRARVARAKGQVREGFRYILDQRELRNVLLISVVVGVFASNFNVVLPLVAHDVLHGGAGTFGALGAIQGLGALIAAVLVAARSRPSKGFLACSSGVLGAALLVAAVVPGAVAEFAAIAFSGAAALAVGVSVNTTMQLGARPDLRGRVIAMYFLVAFGSNVLGGPLMGWIGQTWGARWSLAAGGIPALVVTGVLTVAWRRRFWEPSAVPDVAMAA